MFAPSIIAIIRTLVPAAIGSVIGLAINLGFDVSAEAQSTLTTAIVTLSITAYYALVTYLERNVNPAFGWLLGIAKAPYYDGGNPPGGDPGLVDVNDLPPSETEASDPTTPVDDPSHS